MSLEVKVMDLLKQAMRNKDEAALRTLRSIKAALLIEKTAVGGKDELTGDEELKLLQKMAKQRKESATIFKEKGRLDLAKVEEEELAIIEGFLPKQLSSEELEGRLASIISALGATSMADLGKVMGAASKQLAGEADGKLIADKVKAILSGL